MSVADELSALDPRELKKYWNQGHSWQHYINKVVDENSDRFVSRWITCKFPNPAGREFFQEFPIKVNILALVEDWCIDTLEQMPLVAKMVGANASPASKHPFNLALKLLPREQHLDLMDRLLTQGARAIPKLLFMDDAFLPFAVWGPRPTECQAILTANRGRLSPGEINDRIADWYRLHGAAPALAEIRARLEIHLAESAGPRAAPLAISADVQSGMPAAFDPLQGFETEVCAVEDSAPDFAGPS